MYVCVCVRVPVRLQVCLSCLLVLSACLVCLSVYLLLSPPVHFIPSERPLVATTASHSPSHHCRTPDHTPTPTNHATSPAPPPTYGWSQTSQRKRALPGCVRVSSHRCKHVGCTGRVLHAHTTASGSHAWRHVSPQKAHSASACHANEYWDPPHAGGARVVRRAGGWHVSAVTMRSWDIGARGSGVPNGAWARARVVGGDEEGDGDDGSFGENERDGVVHRFMPGTGYGASQSSPTRRTRLGTRSLRRWAARR